MTSLRAKVQKFGFSNVVVQTWVCKCVCAGFVLYKLFKPALQWNRVVSVFLPNSTVRHLVIVMRALCRVENELREQRRLMEAVRGILTTSVQSELGSEQQAFLQDQRSWEPPAPSAGTFTP